MKANNVANTHVPNIRTIFPWRIPSPFDSLQILTLDYFCANRMQKRMYIIAFLDSEPTCRRHFSESEPKRMDMDYN